MPMIMYFWLNYSDKNKTRWKDSRCCGKHPFFVWLVNYLFLLSDSTQIDNNKYLDSLETTKILIVSTEQQMCKLLA